VSKAKSPQQTQRRLTASELSKLGLTPGSRRYVSRNVKNVTKTTKTISYRQFQNKLTAYKYDEKISRETLTKQRQRGEKTYVSEQTERTGQKISRLSKIRRMIPNIAPVDARLIDKKNQEGWSELTDEEKENFKNLFKRYNADEVREAFGSPRVLDKTYRFIRRKAA
jgi:hypothetical protein